MPAGTLRRCLKGARYCASCLLTLLLWTTWLALALLLSFQVYVASMNEFRVPGFLLHAIENHLAESGVTVKFGKATFDPSGDKAKVCKVGSRDGIFNAINLCPSSTRYTSTF